MESLIGIRRNPHQRPTLSVCVPNSRAMAVFVIPPAAISTIRDRSRSRTVALLDRDHRSRTSRSPYASSILTAFRMCFPSLLRVSQSRTKMYPNPSQPGLTGVYHGHYTRNRPSQRLRRSSPISPLHPAPRAQVISSLLSTIRPLYQTPQLVTDILEGLVSVGDGLPSDIVVSRRLPHDGRFAGGIGNTSKRMRPIVHYCLRLQ